MSPRQSRDERKAILLREIQQQRLDLIATRRDWLEATGVYDRGWSKLVSLRSWAIVASSAMAVVSLRHPRFSGALGSSRAGYLEYLAHGQKPAALSILIDKPAT
ncbi:Uncharacterised protein [Kluyvera cryocrescens]|uniref:Uncharacterized protein n=1 Tax=Kluyvera cryocrescens TaxID=580 RepID=A0A485AIQ2_KLUCR|nr:Uncharacterised protein [Kluyvera cryocrescens]